MLWSANSLTQTHIQFHNRIEIREKHIDINP